MAKPPKVETPPIDPTNIMGTDPIVETPPVETPPVEAPPKRETQAASAPAFDPEAFLARVGETVQAGFKELEKKLTPKPAPAPVATPPPKPSGLILDELDPTKWFEA